MTDKLQTLTDVVRALLVQIRTNSHGKDDTFTYTTCQRGVEALDKAFGVPSDKRCCRCQRAATKVCTLGWVSQDYDPCTDEYGISERIGEDVKELLFCDEHFRQFVP